jgi:hypothetical protein
MKVIDNWLPCPVVNVQVFDYASGGFLATRDIAANEFHQPLTYQEFTLDFDNPRDDNSPEFLVYFTNRVSVWLDNVLLFKILPYDSATLWSLPPIDGQQTILGRFVDTAGNATQTQTSILLDRVQPASSVNSLPVTQTTTVFTVTWTGADHDPGSGVADFDIQALARPVTQTDGIWTNWLTTTTGTSATFTGATAYTYCFRSRACDRAGNVEDYDPSIDGDTCTAIVSIPAVSKHYLYLPIVLCQ